MIVKSIILIFKKFVSYFFVDCFYHIALLKFLIPSLLFFLANFEVEFLLVNMLFLVITNLQALKVHAIVLAFMGVDLNLKT